jgi:hypothetical protein
MISRPTIPVAAVTAVNTVANVPSCGQPASPHSATTELAMAERKMRPTSCTCPTAKGSVLRSTNASWWMAEERKTSLTREPIMGRKKGSCGENNSSRSEQVSITEAARRREQHTPKQTNSPGK